MKRKLYAALIVVGAILMLTGVVLMLPAADVAAQAPPGGDTVQQAKPTPKPTAKPTPKPAGAPTTAPRAGGFPIGLAMPLVAGGAAVAGAGAFMLQRGRRRD